MTEWRARVRRAFYDLRTEGEGPIREAAALGVGVFIGSIPVYGFHLLLCWVTGRLLRLNRLKMYLAANISNPLFSPFLLLIELQTGAWARRHDLHDLSLATLRHTSPWTFGADLLVGSLVVGVLLGVCVAVATYVTGGRRRDDDAFSVLWRRASDPYLASGITAWEFARGKLRGDPVYQALLTPGVLAKGGTILDIGCGGGLALSALREAVRMRAEGLLDTAPTFDHLVGIELRPGAARVARAALQDDAEILEGDAAGAALPRSRSVLLLDVLHMMPGEEQERLLERVSAALEPGGAVVVREADAGAGAGFLAVRIGNRLKALLTGNWRQRFAFRRHAEWVALLARHRLDVQVRDANAGTPFANLLIIGQRGHRSDRNAGADTRGEGASLYESPDAHDGRNGVSRAVVLAAEPQATDRL